MQYNKKLFQIEKIAFKILFKIMFHNLVILIFERGSDVGVATKQN